MRTTVIYVTHDQVEAMTLAERIVVLDKGAIEQVGSPLELYDRPRNLFVARFIGSPMMNAVTGASAARRGAVTLGVRPEHVHLSTTAGEWPARVVHSEHLGSDTFIYAEAEGVGPLTIRLNGKSPHKAGDRVFVTPQESQVHLFDEQGREKRDKSRDRKQAFGQDRGHHRRRPRHRPRHRRALCARRRAGCDRRRADDAAEALARELGEKALAVNLDVTSMSSIEAMVRSVEAKFGGIDILVNNAGVFDMAPIVEVTEASYDRVFAVNVKGLFFALQAVAER